MNRYKLSKLRYSRVFEWLCFIDFIAVLVLWIIGSYLRLNTNEFDQIIRFHYTQSIFDLILLSSCKILLLFILINELEDLCLRIAFCSVNTSSVSSSNTDEVTVNQTLNDDQENLIVNTPRTNDSLKCGKQLLHLMIILICLSSITYTSVKFALVLQLILQDASKPPMDFFCFSIICVELSFSLIELLISVFSWKFMRSLIANVKNQLEQQNESNEKNTKKEINLKRLLRISRPELGLLVIAGLMLCLSSLTNVISPLFFGLVVDAAVKYPDLTEMNKYVIYMFLIYFFGSIAGGLRSWLFELAGQRVVARLRAQVFTAIIRHDTEFFDTNRTGELTSRLSSDSQVLQNAVTVNISSLARYMIQIVGSIVLMLSLEASLTGVLMAVIPAVVLLTVQYGRFLRKLRKKFQDELAASSVIAEETISSSRTVKSFAAEQKMINLYSGNLDKSLAVGKMLALASGGFMGFVGVLTSGALALVLWYGGKLVHEQKITTGNLASFLMYTLQVAMAFGFLSSLYGDFMQALGASQRIFELIDDEPKINADKGLKPSSPEEDNSMFDGSIEFVNVDFTYPTRPETKILKEITFKIEPGKTVALVGPSGGGKSTIISLIERYYDPEAGEIRIGPKNLTLSSFSPNWLHSKIALVSQEPVLFGGSIKENISFGKKEEPSMDEIIHVAKLANAYDFITGLEKGFDTLVGERGIRLSGGQKQRIAIARALLMNPRLLLLDEATSALDSESEYLVQEAIDRAMKDRTVCVIAHRLSTVRNADKVIVIDQGKIVEQGTHDELCQLEGIYKKLVIRQLLSTN